MDGELAALRRDITDAYSMGKLNELHYKLLNDY